MGKVITHIRPDPDALLSLFLLLEYGGYESYDFIPIGEAFPKDAIVVDIKGGRYDHHERGERFCTAHKIIGELKRFHLGIVPILQYTQLADYAALPPQPPTSLLAAFSSMLEIASDREVFECYRDVVRRILPKVSSVRDLEDLPSLLGEEMPPLLKEAIERARDFPKRAREALKGARRFEVGGIKFLAVPTHLRLTGFVFSHFPEVDVYVYFNRQKGWAGIVKRRDRSVPFDLASLKERIEEKDGAEWFLHPTEKLLLCGTPKDPHRQTSLSFDELIEILSSTKAT